MPLRALVAAAGVVAVTITAMPAHARPPFTVPALRHWKPAHGTYRLPAKPRVVAPERLEGAAHTLAGELHGRAVRHHGDIRLTLGATHLPKEGYRLTVRKTGVRISARTPTGAFWGTRT